MHITRVGFGAWAIGGSEWAYGWGTQDDRDSIAAIHRAVERGINWIDTAAVYGLGHSEDVVRRALESLPAGDRPLVFTKGGLVWDESDRSAPPRRRATSASVRREVEDSLRRLGVERIDLYQLHWPASDGTPLEETWQTFLDLQREGKLRAVGLSNHGVSLLERAEALGHVDSLQPPFSAIRRDAAAAEIPWCDAHQTGVIVYSPMQAGLLSGRFTVERANALPADDWRSKDREFKGDKLARNLEFAATLAPIAQARGCSVASVSIAWTLAWKGVTAAIVGARNAEQIDGWLDAANLELSADELRAISASIERIGVGSGPSLPVAG